MAVIAVGSPARGEMPFGSGGAGDTEVHDWAARLLIGEGSCENGNASINDLPASFDCEDYWQLTDFRYPTTADDPSNEEFDPITAANPQSFYGVKGAGVNTAWEVTTGRPDVTIAVMDSGIRWEEAGSDADRLLEKHFINRGELPLPSSGPNVTDPRFDGYDVDGDRDGDGIADGTPDGVFNVVDYWADDTVLAQPQGGDLNGNGFIDPEDLIRIFSDGVDDDGNGYVDDISGWDFFEDDNNPQDDNDHNHGTKEARWSLAEAGTSDGPCLNCMHMPMRVADSFVGDVNQFSEAVVYAVDNGASVVQEALGTLNHTSFGQAAIDHAYRNGVIVMASAADEAAGHHNWPAAYEHTLVINSLVPPTDVASGVAPTRPFDHVYFNGCTNFGGYTYVSVPSDSCSSEATGRSAGMSGLLYSAAWNAVERGDMTPYVRDDGSQASFPLSAEEVKQLWRLAADDIDFSTPAPLHPFTDDAPADVALPTAPANNYATSVPGTTRYQTVQGWDYFTGYGRSNAARLVHFIGTEEHATLGDREYVPTDASHGPYDFGSSPLSAQDRIPPEADIIAPRFWRQYEYRSDGTLVLPDDPSAPREVVVHGRVAANRVTALGGTFGWVLEYAPHVQGLRFPRSQDGDVAPSSSEEASTGPWTPIASGDGLAEAFEGELGRVDVAVLAAALDPALNPFDPAFDPTSEFQPERYAIRLRLRVIADPVDPLDGVNNEAVHQKQIDVLPAGSHTMRDDVGVPYGDERRGLGDADAIDPDALGRYAGGAGSPSFHDLDGDGVDELILPTADGVVHAYTDVAAGTELPGWPVLTGQLRSIARHVAGDGSTPVDNAYTRGDVSTDVHGSLLMGTVAVADLDDDGTPEVIAGDMEGFVYVWSNDGTLRPGFPVQVDRELSVESSCEGDGLAVGGDGICDDYDGPDAPRGSVHGDAAPKRNKWNERDTAINAAPAIGDLDPTTAGLEIVVGANDAHVYAWHADGTPVAGWPVLLRDPTKVESMDPTTRFYVYADGANEERGTKIVVTPSLGDLDADGDLEVVLGVNEEYEETTNMAPEDPTLTALSAISNVGNTRLYALHHTGAATAVDGAAAATAHTQDQAYLDGWPTKMAILATDLLPYVGRGTNGQTPIYDADGDGTLEVANASVIGPGYVFDHDGSSFLGSTGEGQDRTLASGLNDFGAVSRAKDGPAIVGLGSLGVGSLDGGRHLTLTGPGVGLNRLLDVLWDGDQAGSEDHLLLWNTSLPTGDFEPNAPVIVNDLMFFAPAVVADVTGDDFAEAIQATAFSDVVAVGLVPPANTSDGALRWHTGGWSINAPGVGDAPASTDARNLSIATITREGWLRLLPTAAPAESCTALAEWPEYGHDAFNSGNYETDAERPYPIAGLDADALAPGEQRTTLRFTAPGDDRACGTVDHYELRRVDGDVADPDWLAATPVALSDHSPEAAGSGDEVTLDEDLPFGTHTLLLRARDDAGNGSAVATTVVTASPVAPVVTIDGPSTAPVSTATTYTAQVVDGDHPDGPFTYDWSATGDATISGDDTASMSVTWPSAADGTQQTVSVAVTDPDGATGSDQRQVNVGTFAGNTPPVAEAGPATRQVKAGEEVTFVGSGSSDADGDDLTYAWSVSGTSKADPDSGSAVEFTTTFAEADDTSVVTVILTVSDGQADSTDTVQVTVVPNRAPIADAGADRRVVEDHALAFDASGSSDVDDDDLTYAWEFGDGSTASGTTVSHTWDEPGVFTVTLTATDDRGASDSDTAAVVVVDEVPLSGPDRVQTAIEVSRYTEAVAEPGFGDTVVLARRDRYPDALTGAPLARAHNGPVLLTSGDSLSPDVADELDRLGTRQVIVLGGTAAISADVATELRTRGYEVDRVGGTDRFDTARLVAARVPAQHVYVVEGAHPDADRGWPDAVSVAPLAAEEGRPILLVRHADVPTATQRALSDLGATNATIVGGTAAVSDEVEQRLRARGLTVDRVAGADRYATAAAVAEVGAGAQAPTVWVATGRNWPDALAAGPAVPVTHGILLLVHGQDLALSEATREQVAQLADPLRTLIFLGGTAAIEPDVRGGLADALRR